MNEEGIMKSELFSRIYDETGTFPSPFILFQ